MDLWAIFRCPIELYSRCGKVKMGPWRVYARTAFLHPVLYFHTYGSDSAPNLHARSHLWLSNLDLRILGCSFATGCGIAFVEIVVSLSACACSELQGSDMRTAMSSKTPSPTVYLTSCLPPPYRRLVWLESSGTLIPVCSYSVSLKSFAS